MDIVEFAEKVSGLELLESQKQLLRKMQEIDSDNFRIIISRQGCMMVVPKSEHKTIHNKQRGLRTKLLLVDDICDLR